MDKFMYKLMNKLVDEKAKSMNLNASDKTFWEHVKVYLEEINEIPEDKQMDIFSLGRGIESDASIKYAYFLGKTNDTGKEIVGTRFLEWDVPRGIVRANPGIIFGFLTPEYRISQRFDVANTGSPLLREVQVLQHVKSEDEKSRRELSADVGMYFMENGTVKRTWAHLRSQETHSAKVQKGTYSNLCLNTFTNVYGDNFLDTHMSIEGDINQKLSCTYEGTQGIKTPSLINDREILEDIIYYVELLKSNSLFGASETEDNRLKSILEYFGYFAPKELGMEITDSRDKSVYYKSRKDKRD